MYRLVDRLADREAAFRRIGIPDLPSLTALLGALARRSW